MGVRGGDIRQLKINGREFDVDKEANVNLILSGFNNENGLTGNGSLATTQRRKAGGFTDCPVSIKDADKDLEFLQDIWNDGESVPVIITLATGQTYSGSLAGESELIQDTGAGQVTISMMGAKLEQI